MPQNTHIEMAEATRIAKEKKRPAEDFASLRKNAEEIARCLAWNPSVHASRFFSIRWSAMAAALRPVLEKVGRAGKKPSESDDIRWIRENLHMLWAELWNTRNAFKLLRRLPHVRTPRGTTIPRAAGVAEGFLYSVEFDFSERGFTTYVAAFQESTALKFRELWGLLPAMELTLLEQVAARGRRALDTPESSQDVGSCIRGLREINQ